MPCPSNSRSGLVRGTSGAMPSATRALSNDSRAARAATATAGATSCISSGSDRDGIVGAGRPLGSVPMVAAGSPAVTATSVATMSAISEAGSVGHSRCTSSWVAMTIVTTMRGATAAAQSTWPSANQLEIRVDSDSPFGVSSARGICCTAMITPMPKVNPSTTGQGIRSATRPSPVMAMPTSRAPAMMASSGTVGRPYWAITGSSTTVIAPVGPETWRWEPPKTAARMPATMAVTSPAAAPAPEATPKPSARGRATIPTVTPAMSSLGQRCVRPR